MDIKVNGEKYHIEGEEITVEKLLVRLSEENNINLGGAVVLVNDEVVKKNDWKIEKVANNYVVEVLSFVSGG